MRHVRYINTGLGIPLYIYIYIYMTIIGIPLTIWYIIYRINHDGDDGHNDDDDK